MKKSLYRAVGILVLLAGLILTVGTGFENVQAQEKDQPVLQHDVSVVLKLIQIYVTDKEGKPVTDLTKSDFTLTDNGKKVEVTDFESHFRKKSGGAVISEHGNSGRFETSIARNFFLFFDFSYNNPEGIREAKKAALDFLATKIAATDRVGVLSYSPVKNLKIHQFLTDDHETARKSVESLIGAEETRGAGNEDVRGVELQIQLKDANERHVDSGTYSDELDFIRGALEEQPLLARSYADNIKALAKGLSKIPGRKNLLFFSSGLPSSLFSEPLVVNGKPSHESREKSLSEQPREQGGNMPTSLKTIPETDSFLLDQYKFMVRELAAANCAVFPIYSNMDRLEKSLARLEFSGGQFFGKDALQWMADGTGGRFFNTVRGTGEIMESIDDLTGAYYVLGYSLREKKDGKFHALKVSVNRKGCEVHVPSGYFAPKEFSKFTKLERTLHFLDLASNRDPETMLEFPFSFEAYPSRFEDGSGFVQLARFPVEEFEKLSGKSVEITELVFDEAGRQRSSWRGIYDLRTLSDKDIVYYGGHSLPPGLYTSKIVVRNLETGKASRAEVPVAVPWPGESGITFGKPLIMVPSGKTRYITGAGGGLSEDNGKSEKGDSGKDLFISVFPMIESGMTPADSPYRIESSRFIVMAQCRINEPDLEDLEFSLILKSPATDTVIKPAARSKCLKTGGQVLSLFTEVDVLNVPSGDYMTELSLTDKNSGRKWTLTVPVSLKS